MKFEDAGDGKFNVSVTAEDMWEFRAYLTEQNIIPNENNADAIQEKFFAWCRNKREEIK